MSGIWGKQLQVAIFGESHGPAIGITISGLPAGLALDEDKILVEMARRRPGQNELTTPRREEDLPDIVSGYFNGHTTGAPLTALIYNTNTRSKDYSQMRKLMRPGQTDYPALKRYDGYNDYRGSGHFSGRITAPLVFAGAVCQQWLDQYGVTIGSRICSIGEVKDQAEVDFQKLSREDLLAFRQETLPVLTAGLDEEMARCIRQAKGQHDAVGGIVETFILGLEAGYGNPFFNSIESTLAQLIFSVPATKGIEFGAGFDIASMLASEANDNFYYDDEGQVQTTSLNNGGIVGGISLGTPINFRTAIKAPASIAKAQATINIESHENVELEVTGRHDPCIVPRVLPVIEAVTAIGLMDLILTRS
ncbi:chorismate synthase [Aerococcus sanguinicola]|uniref:chorismate synthase n=1 Tax=unclassified Aerococcus TaxID=2618060 RepID=UPI0008A302D9|nr:MULTISPECIES: chorismate synthase [unclassified Aerococcus]MDK6232660.1 chorismate synthase [Aerococcus sp. UMB10185]MDK6855050.1 chorismate synthase [Aerococcus sp. UMB7533]MDK8501683.1 chorismate synthase [Aerococcus sp. UMB1112A]OFN02517.1 chorismate synthase [Aerococcus sp. HMSC062A02]OHO45688.1 chorismate synthase [Aerococcus sp. HMSC035B07]